MGCWFDEGAKHICVLDLQQRAMFGLADALVTFISRPSHCYAFFSLGIYVLHMEFHSKVVVCSFARLSAMRVTEFEMESVSLHTTPSMSLEPRVNFF